MLSADILKLIDPEKATFSQLLEVAVASGQFPSGDKPLQHIAKLPTTEELELAKIGRLTLWRATELGMYDTPGTPATVEEWEKALKCDENGLAASACLGFNRTQELGLSKTKFIP